MAVFLIDKHHQRREQQHHTVRIRNHQPRRKPHKRRIYQGTTPCQHIRSGQPAQQPARKHARYRIDQALTGDEHKHTAIQSRIAQQHPHPAKHSRKEHHHRDVVGIHAQICRMHVPFAASQRIRGLNNTANIPAGEKIRMEASHNLNTKEQ